MSPLAGEREQATRKSVAAGDGPTFKDAQIGQVEPLYEAVVDGQEQMVADLLAAGACPNARFRGEEGYAPLHVASSRGHVGILATLLAFGAYRDALDNRGARPLHHAIAEDRFAATETLLAAGALSAAADDNSSFRPLVLAACKGNKGIINLLLKHGGVDVNSRDDVVGATALHAAANWSSGAAAVHALVDAGAKINVQRKDGGSPLHYAAASRTPSPPSSSPFETILALLERGASVNQIHSGTAQTPLLVACQHRPRGLDSVVDLLLRWGGDQTAVGGDGRTASELLELDLHHATENERQCDLAHDDEMERARSLLARAKEDRAWRRRCLPVMLRARQQGVRTAQNGNIEAGSRCGRDYADLEVGQTEGSESIGIGGTPGSANEIGDSNGIATTGLVDNSGVEGDSQSLASDGGSDGMDNKEHWTRVVHKLVGLTSEGVFRTIVGFL